LAFSGSKAAWNATEIYFGCDLIMNRSFLIIIIPAIAVALGYFFVLRWLGYQLEPFRFVMAGVIAVAAVILVQRHQRRKASRSKQ
jgi:ABC-type spermidine/putrescine transport system permease subunit II